MRTPSIRTLSIASAALAGLTLIITVVIGLMPSPITVGMSGLILVIQAWLRWTE